MPEAVERKLVAILAADVAGYSRLVGLDEEGTLARLKILRREVIDPEIASHRGRIVKTTGDGLLIEFVSVVDAVRCAVAVQRACVEREAALPQDRRFQFRVGINLGDIVVDGDDILGDGVNIAARLEGIADPGGICISGVVHDQVRGKVEMEFADLGRQTLKNITQPVQAYRVLLDEKITAASTPPFPLPDKPSIAVLPFQNMSGDPEQEYFADGMVEEITTAIARLPWLFVIARNSAFTYKGRAVDVKQVARELGVRYILEGSLRKAGNRIRVTAQLVEADTGSHVWAERYDRDLADIFAVQDEITEAVTIAVAPAIAEAERHRAMRKPPESLDAWAAYQRGTWHLGKATPEDTRLAHQFFQQAIDLDPSFAGGYIGLASAISAAATAFGSAVLAQPQSSEETLPRRAIATDPGNAEAY